MYEDEQERALLERAMDRMNHKQAAKPEPDVTTATHAPQHNKQESRPWHQDDGGPETLTEEQEILATEADAPIDYNDGTLPMVDPDDEDAEQNHNPLVDGMEVGDEDDPELKDSSKPQPSASTTRERPEDDEIDNRGYNDAT